MIRLIVTDLDNTLYDWVGAHVPAFNAMVTALGHQTGHSEVELLASFRRVHQRRRTSEYAFGVLELDVLAQGDKSLTPAQRLAKYKEPLHAFYRTRDQHLRLYDGVTETLRKLRADGKQVVAHTDAMMLYASGRVCQLGLEEVLDGLFATSDHPVPPGVTLPDAYLYSDGSRCRSHVPIQEELDVLKPDVEVLHSILERFDVAPDRAIYVGDSLFRDVLLAQRAGVPEVFARYGANYGSDLYKRLVEITHWNDDDIARETELRRHQVTPSYTINRYSELLDVVSALDGRATASPTLC